MDRLLVADMSLPFHIGYDGTVDGDICEYTITSLFLFFFILVCVRKSACMRRPAS